MDGWSEPLGPRDELRANPTKGVTMKTQVCSILVPALLAGSLASACATNAGSGALIGGGAGAALGAGIGAIAGGGKGAAIGAGIGGVVGAGAGLGVGVYMDKQEERLRNELKAAHVVREGDKIVVRFKSAILFDSNHSELKGASEQDLTAFAKVLKDFPETKIAITGFTDSTGSKETNERLSRERAEAVGSYLDHAGVQRSRMAFNGAGPERPVASNSTSEGRSQNRRVEIEIIPSEDLKKKAQAQGEG
jgi:outer membrane protein OmpA-like peptidoglycan-associated protein